MAFDFILDNISKHITLNKKEQDFFISLLEHELISRKTRLLTPGEICKHNIFVINGCIKSFSIDEQGIEHILNFALRGWWIADLYSLISQKPGVLNIVAVVDTEVFLLSRDAQQQLYHKVPKFERFFRIIVENSLVANHQRLIGNLSLTAEERYVQFIKKYPSILEHVPLHNIASYLGITPEFLSKIRARLAKRV